jgi:hypothetical protein
MTRLGFADHKVKKEYERILSSKEDAHLAKSLKRAIEDLRNDPRCGLPIQKNLIPREYFRNYTACHRTL